MTTTVRESSPTQPAAPRRRKQASSSSMVSRFILQNLAVFAVTVLIMLAAASSFNGMFRGWLWMWDIALVVAVVAAAISVARVVGSVVSQASWLDQEPQNQRANIWIRSFVPSLAGLVALFGVIVARFLPETSFFGIIPTPATSQALREMVEFASDEVMTQVTPVLASPALIALTCFAVGLLVIMLDLLAFGVGFPAISGIIPASLLMVSSLVETHGAGIGAVAATAVGYLLLLAVAQWVSTSRLQGGRLPQFLTIVAAALVAILLVPAAIPGFNSGLLPEGKRFYLFGEPTGVNPVLNLGANLSQPLALDSIFYYTDAKEPVYLRTAVVSDLADSRWGPTDVNEGRMSLNEAGVDLPRQRVSRIDASSGTSETSTVEIRTGNYNSPWLPIPHDSAQISGMTAAWGWNPATATIFSSSNAPSADQNYTVSTQRPTWDAQEMANIVQAQRLENFVLRQRLPEETEDSGSELIANTYQDVLTEAKIPANTSDKFAIGIAIQNYLRSTRFTYSEQTPLEQGYDGAGVNVVNEFLRVRAGYCIHYSSAMALMAREAGIPSRIVVGYSPGRATGNSVNRNGVEMKEYAVSSRNAHAWPELYFEGLGWIPFEPTPGRGSTPDYAPEASAAAESTQPSEQVPTQSTPTTESVPDSPVAEDTTVGLEPGAGDGGFLENTWERTLFISLGALLVGLLALLIPFFIRRTRRSRTMALARDPAADSASRALAAWRELTDTAKDYGFAMRPEESAAAFSARLESALRAPGNSESVSFQYDAAAPLQRLRSAFEVARYAPVGTVLTDVDVASDLSEVEHAFRERADSKTQFRARYWPPSVVGAARKH